MGFAVAAVCCWCRGALGRGSLQGMHWGVNVLPPACRIGAHGLLQPGQAVARELAATQSSLEYFMCQRSGLPLHAGFQENREEARKQPKRSPNSAPLA